MFDSLHGGAPVLMERKPRAGCLGVLADEDLMRGGESAPGTEALVVGDPRNGLQPVQTAFSHKRREFARCQLELELELEASGLDDLEELEELKELAAFPNLGSICNPAPRLKGHCERSGVPGTDGTL